MKYAHQPDTARTGRSAGKILLNGVLFALLSVLAAVQVAQARVPTDRAASTIARAAEPRTGLSSGSLRLAIHVNRDEVEGDDDRASGSS